jgi:hypothetical protein
MWIFTTEGFVSIVQAYGDATSLVVRSRDRLSLEPLSDRAEVSIASSPERDYPYRVVAPREAVESWLVESVRALDYHNFKDEVAHSRGRHFAHALLSVWSAMHDVEDAGARGRA